MRLIVCLFVALFALIGCTEVPQTNDWPDVQTTMRPWTRWWWMGSAVDKKNIRKNLINYHQAGIGGVEITPIYGAKGYEAQYIDFLSPKWMEMLRFTIATADSLGMGVDMDMGTGWPYGGPQIDESVAATKMKVEKQDLAAGSSVSSQTFVAEGARLTAVVAFSANENIDLLKGKESEDWEFVASEPTEIYAIYAVPTEQKVKRAAPGGAGFVMDHLNDDGFEVYSARFDDAYGADIPGIRAYFNDSYEVYHADFTPDFFNYFERKRGYDLRVYLKTLLSEEENEEKQRIRADYRKTMGEMLLQNFTNPWKNWASSHSAVAKNQAHGSPGNLLDVYAAVDIPECETFGYSGFEIKQARNYTHSSRHTPPDLYMLKFASSAAHVTGKPLVSSETFTWLGEHFKIPLAQAKPELDQAFLAGVNHVFFHGTTYSPEEAGFPGWLFYASTHFGPTNTFWPHIKGLNDYIARAQSVLQTGQYDGDVLLYFPYDDAIINANPEHLEYLFTVHNIPEWLHGSGFYDLAKSLTENGYQVDYLSDEQLGQLQLVEGRLSVPGGNSFASLVIPAVEYLPLATAENIKQLIAQGAPIIIQQMPEKVAGFYGLTQDEAAFESLQSALAPKVSENVLGSLAELGVSAESMVKNQLKFIRRKNKAGFTYFIANQTANDFDGFVALGGAKKDAVLMDPMTGKIGNAQLENGKVKLQLKSGQAVIVQSGAISADDWTYFGEAETIKIASEWTVKFLEGGPALPESLQLSSPAYWTDQTDSSYQYFSGLASYSTKVDIAKSAGKKYLLRFDDIRESAEILINGQSVGILWMPPFELEISDLLVDGENTIEVKVANLMANRIRYMDQQGIEWKKYHEINFVNIDYQHFEAGEWEVLPSGISGDVLVVGYN